jgi:hypothetical protein
MALKSILVKNSVSPLYDKDIETKELSDSFIFPDNLNTTHALIHNTHTHTHTHTSV